MSNITMPPPRIGRVSLAVADVDRSVRYYEDVIGLTTITRDQEMAEMGAGETTFLQLVGQQGARPVQRAAGLYHFAILVPSRAHLARTLKHLLENDASITGFADHHVSEAIDLNDPDGHGIEIYRDRPREEWSYRNGTIKMSTDPIDLHGILGELNGESNPSPVMAPGTFMGHVHLQVADIPRTEAFYGDLLGLDLMLRYGPRATFMSYNGYHHHLGGNTWAGENLPPASNAARLLWYELVQPDAAAVERIAAQLEAAGHTVERGEHALWTVDPSGIRVLVSAAE